MATYTYDPTKILEKGKDKMRFELGDIDISSESLSSVLCDEEYIALISGEKNWRKAKIKCLEAILMRFAHQVNTSVDGLSYSYAQRWDFWKRMLDDEKSKASLAVPTVDPASLGEGTLDGGHYFYADMMHNPDYKGGGENV